MNLEKLLRNKFIYEELKKGSYPSLNEMREMIRSKFALVYSPKNEEISLSTLNRDLRDIEKIFGVNIEFDDTKRGYYIDNSEHEIVIEKALESLNLFYLLENTPEALRYIRFSPRKASGTDYFVDILHAITDNKKVRFIYKHYEKDGIAERIVSPLGLKEFKGFWYLIADDKGTIKVFGLDRISGLAKYNENAKRPKNFDIDDYFKHCYGIVRFPDSEPEEVLIKMKPIKAAYYKANPLHHSQKIVEENKKYVVVSLYVYYTYDLKQELRSHLREELEVIQPKDSLNSERYY